jgi:hypothetical protein
MQPIHKPFLPSDRHRNGQPFVRAIAISLATFANKSHIKDELKSWPSDRDAEIIIKAASNQASLTGSGWADQLAATAISDFVGTLGPASAGSALLRRGLVLQFNNKAAINVPTILASANNASFVQEGAPIPSRQLSLTGPQLSPRKFATLATFMREIFSHSVPTIESIVRATLTESVGLALDAALLSNAAGDATRPPGLLQGISALTASNNSDRVEAAFEDISMLASAVSAVAGNGPIVFVCAPKQAVALRLRLRGDFPYEALASSALAAGTVIAIAPNALASATDPVPRFDISDQATVHLDTVPSQIGTPGSPNVVAAKTISLYQSDVLSLRMIFELSWVLRHASGLAWTQGVVW